MVKRLLFLFFLLPISVFSQAYIPFPNSMIEYGLYDQITSDGDHFYIRRIEMYGDTVIGAYTYRKVYSGKGPIIAYSGIRQDIPGKKVFQYDFLHSSERVLYDFNLNVGDTVNKSNGYGFYYGMYGANPNVGGFGIDTAWVTSIDSVLMPHDGLYHKRFNFSATITDTTFCGPFSIQVTSNSVNSINLPCGTLDLILEPLIEGVGQLYGPIKLEFLFEGGFSYDLLCASIDGNTVVAGSFPPGPGWHLDESLDPMACYSLTSVQEIVDDNQIHLYPNPTNGKFQLEVENSKSNRLEITDVLGKTVLQSETKNQTTEIDLSFAQKGIYFVKVMDDKGNFVVKKIVKE